MNLKIFSTFRAFNHCHINSSLNLCYSSCDLLNSSIKPDVIIPAGKATTAIPRKDEIIVIIFIFSFAAVSVHARAV